MFGFNYSCLNECRGTLIICGAESLDRKNTMTEKYDIGILSLLMPRFASAIQICQTT